MSLKGEAMLAGEVACCFGRGVLPRDFLTYGVGHCKGGMTEPLAELLWGSGEMSERPLVLPRSEALTEMAMMANAKLSLLSFLDEDLQ